MNNRFLYKSYLKSTVFESTELTEGEFWRNIKKGVANTQTVKGTSQFINKWFGSYYKSNVGDFREYLDNFRKKQEDFADLTSFEVGDYKFEMVVKELQILKGPNLAKLGESVLTEDDIEDAEQAKKKEDETWSDLEKADAEEKSKKKDLEDQLKKIENLVKEKEEAAKEAENIKQSVIDAQKKIENLVEEGNKTLESLSLEKKKHSETVKNSLDTAFVSIMTKYKVKDAQKVAKIIQDNLDKGNYKKVFDFFNGEKFSSSKPEIEKLKTDFSNMVQAVAKSDKKMKEQAERIKQQKQDLETLNVKLKNAEKNVASKNKEYELAKQKEDEIRTKLGELSSKLNKLSMQVQDDIQNAEDLEKLTHKPEELKAMENPEWITIENPSKQSLMTHRDFRFLTRKEYYGVYPSLLNLMFKKMKKFFASALKKDPVSGEFEQDLEDKNFKVKLSFKFKALDAKKAENAKISGNEEDSGVIPSIVEELKAGKSSGDLKMYNVHWEFDMTVTNTNDIIQYEKECKDSGIPLGEIEKLRSLSKEVHGLIKENYHEFKAAGLGEKITDNLDKIDSYEKELNEKEELRQQYKSELESIPLKIAEIDKELEKNEEQQQIKKDQLDNEKRKNQTKSEGLINKLQTNIKILKDEYKKLEDEKKRLEKQLEKINKELDKSNSKSLVKSISNLKDKLRASRNAVETLNKQSEDDADKTKSNNFITMLSKEISFFYKNNFLKLVKDKDWETIDKIKEGLKGFKTILDVTLEQKEKEEKDGVNSEETIEKAKESYRIINVINELNPKITDIMNSLDNLKENENLEETKIETPAEIAARAKEGLLKWLNPDRVDMRNVSSNSDDSATYSKDLIVGRRDNKRSPVINFTLELETLDGNPIS